MFWMDLFGNLKIQKRTGKTFYSQKGLVLDRKPNLRDSVLAELYNWDVKGFEPRLSPKVQAQPDILLYNHEVSSDLKGSLRPAGEYG